MAILVIGAIPLGAQTTDVVGSWRPVNPFLEEEAPPYLLDLDVGDTEVELFVLGSWTAESVFATSLAIHPPLPDSDKRVTWGYPYPDFETRLLDQTVDLTLSLWLYRRYFFEASFADDSDVNSIAAGYFAAEDELVQEFVVGNVPLAVGRYPYQYAGNTASQAGRKPNPGTVLRLQSDTTFHEFLLQLENSSQQSIQISDGGVTEEARIAPESFLPGRAFVLPDPNITDVEVLIQDEDGDILGILPTSTTTFRFRRLNDETGDYVVDTNTGTLRLADSIPSSPTVAVYYRTVRGPVGDAANGKDALIALEDTGTEVALSPTTGRRDFSFDGIGLFGLSNADVDYDGADFRLALSDGREALVVRSPGLWTPFEAANLYSLPEGTGEDARFQITQRYSDVPIESQIRLQRIPGTDLLRAVRSGAGERDLGYRYPWAEEEPRAINARIYGPRADADARLTETEIYVQYTRTADTVLLDGDIVPGSVVITAQGRSVSGASVDYNTGEITLPANGGLGTVDVSYRVYGDAGDTADLVVINGNRWQPSPNLEATIATGLRWTLTENGYSTELNQHPGQLTVSSGVQWGTEDLSLAASGAVQLSQSDTTGFMRLYGGSSDDAILAVDATTVFPSGAAPSLASRTVAYDTAATDASPLTEATRALPRYRDYWTSDLLGNITLQSYQSLPSADTDRSGSRIGPYIARSNDPEYSGTVAVLEWDEIPEQGWTGARLSRAGTDIDLRNATSIVVSYRYINDGGAGSAPKLLFEVGSLAEDVDNDGVLDRGPSAVEPSFEFDTTTGPRRAGQDAPALSAPHSEDSNRNGVLDGEPASAVVSHLLTDDGDSVPEPSDTAGEGWQRVEIPLDAAARSRLRAVRAARIIAIAPGSSVPAGRVLIGNVVFKRSQSVSIVDPGSNGTARATNLTDPLFGAESLRSQHDLVASRFVPDDASQYVSRLSWNENAEQVAAEFPIPDFSTRSYRTIAGYFFLDAPTSNTDGETVSLALKPYRAAPSRETILATFGAPRLTAGWHEVSIDIETEEVTIDGSSSGAAVSVGNAVDDAILAIATITVDGISSNGIGAGSLYFDELHGTDGRTGFSLAGRVHAGWNHTVETGPFAGTEFYATQTVAAQGEDFQAAGIATTEGVEQSRGSTIPGRGAVVTESKAGIIRDTFLLEGEVLARDSENDTNPGFGHTIRAPLFPKNLIVGEETFFRDYRQTTRGFDRSLALTIGSEEIGTYRGLTRHHVRTVDTEQAWQIDLAPPKAGPLAVTLQSDAALFAPRFRIESEDYGDSWVRSNTLLTPIPERDSDQERRQESAVRFDIGPVEIGSTLGWTNRSSLSGEQEDRIEIETALPLEFRQLGQRPWGITPSYRREYSFTREVESNGFSSDAEKWGQQIGKEPFVFTTVPGWELFASESVVGAPELGPEAIQRSYGSEGRIRFSRVFSSRIRDLWTPSSIEALVQRDTLWEGTTVSDTRLWQLGFTAVAVNLFGVQGSYPRTTRYQSDEFRNALLLGIQEYPGSGEPIAWSIGIEQESGFFGSGENKLDLLNTIDLQHAETTTATFDHSIGYTWDRFGYPKIAIFERMEEKPFYRHEERLTLTYTVVDREFDGSILTIGHTTRLMVTPQGSVSAFGDIGWNIDPGEYEDGSLHLLGLRLGLEGRLSY